MFFQEERIERILKDLRGVIYSKRKLITTVMMKKGDFLSPEEALESENPWEEFKPHYDRWGGRDERSFFRIEIVIPKELHGEEVSLEIKTGREGDWDAINPQFLIYLNEKIVQGLDVNHREIIITKNAVEGDKYIVDLHAYAGMKEGRVELIPEIAAFHRIIEKVYYDIKVPLEVAKLQHKTDRIYVDIMEFLTNAVNMLDLRVPYSKEYYEALEMVERYLDNEFYNNYCGKTDATVTCVGHTHIDVAWLWTLRQTREKVARSFSTVLNLMEEYPEYIFMASQPQLYEFLKERHPEVYEKIKEKIKEGVWEAEGAMWLEADCNLASGESLIRQILFGKRFFKEEFGVENKLLWLPDVFGYSAALPQILKKFGIDYFSTTKISWNEYNKMPYDTFMWEGIDGTEILSYFVTTQEYSKVTQNNHRTIYEGTINPSQIKGSWERYQQKNINDDILVSFGYGDGGGGATRDMLENAKRLQKGIPGCPKVKMGNTSHFFKDLEKKVVDNKKLPKWVGELYLEYHRGTYTSMARNKMYNRKSEFLYEDIELFNTISGELNKDYVYPKEKINKGWKGILLNQFHDIIPGSSIKEVYDESWQQYEELIKDGQELLGTAFKKITSDIKLDRKSLIVFNQLSFDRDDIVEFGSKDISDCSINVKEADKFNCLKDEKGNSYPIQKIGEDKYIAYVAGVPSKGYKVFKLANIGDGYAKLTENNEVDINLNRDGYSDSIEISNNKIENDFFSIELDEAANMTTIYDKINQRHVLKEGRNGNILQAFDDRPHNFEAWDINIYFDEKMWEINEVEEVKVIEKGPVRATLKIVKRFLDSKITQYVHVYKHIARIDIENEIDWKNNNILLKAAFPVDVHTNKATYDIQYGNIERVTHSNTSWDAAQFEVCGHKWADLSEDDYGVSLLNDSKYGYDIKNGVMRLTLLKSATWPNPEADKETHRFIYSLYPHKNDWKRGKTHNMAYMLNCPMYSVLREKQDGELSKEFSFIRCDKDNVFVEVVKKAEDNGNEIIVRLYECHNKRTIANLTLSNEIEWVKEVDLNEREILDIKCNNKQFRFKIHSYEIKTFRIKLKDI